MSNENKISTTQYLEHISDTELRQIVRSMIHDQPKLIEDIKQYHQAILDLDFEDIACEVESELYVLDVQDLWETSGSTRYGYVDTGDRAYEMMEEVLEPFHSDFLNKLKLGEIKTARQILKGVALGLYWYETRVENEFKDWSVGCAHNLLCNILREWSFEPFERDEMLNEEWDAFIGNELDNWI